MKPFASSQPRLSTAVDFLPRGNRFHRCRKFLFSPLLGRTTFAHASTGSLQPWLQRRYVFSDQSDPTISDADVDAGEFLHELRASPAGEEAADSKAAGKGIAAANHLSLFTFAEDAAAHSPHNLLDVNYAAGEQTPLNWKTGTPFPLRAEEVLVRAARLKSFQSRFWITETDLASGFGGEVLLDEDPTDIGDGTGPLRLFNCQSIEETDLYYFLRINPMPKECAHRPNNWVYINGHWTPYGDKAFQALCDDYSNRHFSGHRRWIDADVVQQKHLAVKQHHRPVDGTPPEKKVLVFNADQTTCPSAINRSWDSLYSSKSSK